MSTARTDSARIAVRKVLRDARDKNKWRKVVRFRLWMPVVLQLILIGLVMWYAESKFPGFINERNVTSVLFLAVPLAIVAMGQTHALLVGALDLSVGAMVTFGVVIASFLIGTDSSNVQILMGSAVILLAGVGLGLVNAGLIRGFKIPSIIATLATLSILNGISLTLRETSGGRIDRRLHRVAVGRVGPDPDRVHRGGAGRARVRLLVARQRLGPAAALGRVRRTVGQAQRRPDDLGPGTGDPARGAPRGGGLVLRDGPLEHRERADRRQLRARQHHGRRAGRRGAVRRPRHVPRCDGGLGAVGAHHHRAAVPRPDRRPRTDDHRHPRAGGDRPLPAGRPQGAGQAELQAGAPAGGRERPPKRAELPELYPDGVDFRWRRPGGR